MESHMIDSKLLESTLQEIEALRGEVLALEDQLPSDHPNFQSLLNLKQYLLLRQEDRTQLQEKLFLMSLSSLGRSTAHVAASIETLSLQLKCSETHQPITAAEENRRHISILEAIKLTSQKSRALFGGESSERLSKQKTSVMITLPSYAADDDGLLIRQLAEAGVRIFRINTAHDNAAVWQAMADVIKDINKDLEENKLLKIFVDLAGPKIRTGAIRKIEVPIKIGSKRESKEIILYPDNKCDGVATSSEITDPNTLQKSFASICISKQLFKHLEEEDELKIVDSFDKKATILITHVDKDSAQGVIHKKLLIDKHSMVKKKDIHSHILHTQLQTEEIRLFIGDQLLITEESKEGHAAVLDPAGRILQPATISCSFQNIASFVAIDDKVFIDDGKIGLKVVSIGSKEILCEVTNAKASGTALKEEKGINFPDSHINTPALTPTDRENLLSVINFADDLSISFCQCSDDVQDIQKLLIAQGRSDIGIITKIETKRAVTNMPQILEALLECEKSGVMIARGDLAIEVGFTHMAAIQEELLDICNAAHIPVIWATQVLESQMKNNLPSRAEISDAAISGRAECVMLNKGPFAIDTIGILKDILHEMHLLFKRNSKLLGENRLWSKS